MESSKVEALPRTHLRAKEERHKKKSRKHLWGALFLELFLEELKEQEPAADANDSVLGKQEDMDGMPQIDGGEFGIKICCFQGDEFRESIARTEIFRTRASEESPRMKRDTLELTLAGVGMTSLSECYNDIGRMMRGICLAARKQIFYESFHMMRDYYDGAIPKDNMKELFRGYCRIHIAIQERSASLNQEDAEKWQIRQAKETLVEIYDYFNYANTRCAVMKNNEEGRALVEMQEMYWTGISYYNSDYYFACAEMKQMFRTICDEITDLCGMDHLDFYEMEENTAFTWDGGLSYHGVWRCAQMQVNAPYGQYGMRNEALVPPEHFIYLYKNTYSESDKKAFSGLKIEIEKLWENKSFSEGIWKEYYTSDNDYHNGMSYLPEQMKEMIWQEEHWELFVKNFKLYRISGNMEALYLLKD